jgi:hypothetical protein
MAKKAWRIALIAVFPFWLGALFLLPFSIQFRVWIFIAASVLLFIILCGVATARLGIDEASNKSNGVRSVRDHFLNDFALNAVDLETNYRSEDGSKQARIKFRVQMDFQSKSKFVTLYVPSSSLAYDVCKDLPKNLRTYSDQAFGGMTGYRYRSPSDNKFHDAKDLIFTRQIIIYHEDDMTFAQLGTLEGIYHASKLGVIFRDKQYAYSRWMEKKAMPPASR